MQKRLEFILFLLCEIIHHEASRGVNYRLSREFKHKTGKIAKMVRIVEQLIEEEVQNEN